MFKASDELRLCADAHEEEVITKDSYGIIPLLQEDPNIEYVMDIGANTGSFSVHIQRLLPNAKIISCEPEERMMQCIKDNTDNKLIYVQKAIIGDDSINEVKFNICKWQGNHHVDGTFNWDAYAPVGSEKIGERIVQATTIAKLVKEYEFPRIDLLKIDTEGSEPAILAGIKPWLKNIKQIVGEWHSQKDLAMIKEILQDTHDAVYSDGFFKEPSGLTANGNFTADLK